MNTYCSNPSCGEPFHADESSDGQYCSWNCAEEHAEALDQNGRDYDEAFGPKGTPRLSERRSAEFLAASE